MNEALEALKEACYLVLNSGFFTFWLTGFLILLSTKIALWIFRYLYCEGFTFQKEPDTQEEITYVNPYDDELLELMAKYDEMDKQHKKQKGVN